MGSVVSDPEGTPAGEVAAHASCGADDQELGVEHSHKRGQGRLGQGHSNEDELQHGDDGEEIDRKGAPEAGIAAQKAGAQESRNQSSGSAEGSIGDHGVDAEMVDAEEAGGDEGEDSREREVLDGV